MRSGRTFHAHLMASAAVASLLATPAAARAAETMFNIAPQSLETALADFSSQSLVPVLATPAITGAKTTRGVVGSAEPSAALAMLLQGTGLTYRQQGDTFLIVRAADPQSGSAAGGGAEVEALIVTAQKREEDIQDVPIAISAFSQETLERSQIAGGPDLITQVPNMTFTKTNFSSYSIQLRGIGTQAISATTDPAVAVAFNNTPFIRNRFFEQEFYDLQRVEVLRGPQGTLYGRNATAGVVNIISAKPKFVEESKLSADIANYNSTRLEGMINLPLVEDIVALRLAGAWTKREGFVTNEITGNPIDGRDLWSTRASLRFTPNDRLDVNLIWEHFEEDDDRLRSGKQLCDTHTPTEIAGFTESVGIPISENAPLPNIGQGGTTGSSGFAGAQAVFSQGCSPTSMYAPESFQTPNGFSLPYYIPLGAVFLPTALDNPYVNATQSQDLRVIESTVDPSYRAKSDLVELQVSYDLTDTLTLSSETAWASDFIFSTQDFNRFNTAPGAWSSTLLSSGTDNGLIEQGILRPGPNGFTEFCDPQIGCADRLVAIDLSTAESSHFSQEFRIGSDFDGPFNFSLGANFLRYDTEDKYYVFINSLSMISAIGPFGSGNNAVRPYQVGVTDNRECMPLGPILPDYTQGQPILRCTYIDPNPIESLNDQGHNYFLSRNPYKLISYAVFGEAYYNITDALKVTAGLRWTVDKKEAPRIPSWLLASESVGYSVAEVQRLEWREPTGRLAVDWKPDLAFTDETLLYASYAHGYKAGGANPPPAGVAIFGDTEIQDIIISQSTTHPKAFEAEFVDAFELGTKNTLLDGRLTLNANAFYYDYKAYQISQIINRSAVNYNFDTEVWGLEIEVDWRPLENLKLGFKGGYEKTRVADGEQAIDIMDRTAGNDDWLVVRPFPSIPSNCVLPAWLFVGNTGSGPANPQLVNLGGLAGGTPGGCELAYLFGFDPVSGQFGLPFTHSSPINYAAWSTDPADYPGANWPGGVVGTDYPGWDPATAPNNGEGFFKQLGGNELPNAPHFTATITADYTIPLPNDWLATLHTDLYYQSEAWTRIFNTEGYDKLKAYTNANLAAIFTNDDAGWKVMAYVKNVFDRDSITGSFLNSDDTGLTTNVFLTEPRLYGLRVTKEWTGGSMFSGFASRGEGPYPFTVELGGQAQRHDASYETLRAPAPVPVPPATATSFEEVFQDSLDIFGEPQHRDLDWGDGRDVKLTFRPGGGWSVSAGVRYGKTNNDTTRLHALDESEQVCGLPEWHPYRVYVCDPTGSYYDKYNIVQSTTVWSAANARSREEHQLIDFSVGKDIGIGGLSRSTLSAGIRYGQFESTTSAYIAGVPDRFLKEGWFFASYNPAYGTLYHRYEGDLRAEREFEGTGPVLSWDASLPLLGSQDTGRLQLDWSVSGGVLFGDQQTSVQGSGEVREFTFEQNADGDIFGTPTGPAAALVPIDIERSEDVTVPVAGASLGLSYDIGRINIGAGYRWERYFDVLDVGFDEKQDADRTIDGPYFKVSVGFGG